MLPNISKKRIENLDCVLGLDCSKYQKDITWSKVKAAGIEFAFIKITEGTTGHEDNIYNIKARILEAQKNNVKVGYYHFARPGNVANPEDDAIEEANNVISHVKFLPKADLPLVLDIESYSSDNIWTDKVDHMNRFIKAFICKLREQNISVIIYSYKSFIDTNTSSSFNTNPLWIAAYINNPEKSLPSIPKGWNEWKIWQFTSIGKIDGYNGEIDLNIMKKEYFNLY